MTMSTHKQRNISVFEERTNTAKCTIVQVVSTVTSQREDPLFETPPDLICGVCVSFLCVSVSGRAG